MYYCFLSVFSFALVAASFLHAEPPIGPGFQIHNKTSQKLEVVVKNPPGGIPHTLKVGPGARMELAIDTAKPTIVAIKKPGGALDLCQQTFKSGATIYINYDGKQLYPQQGSKFWRMLGEKEPGTGGAIESIFKSYSLKNNTTEIFDCP